MATLYELTAELRNLYEAAVDPEFDRESLDQMLSIVNEDFEAKAEGYGKLIRQLDADVTALKAERDRLNERIKIAENARDRMKKALFESMKATDKKKFKTALFTFSVRSTPPSVHILEGADINSVLPFYVTYKEPEWNKTAIKEALKNGEKLEFAELVSGETLSIR